MSNELPTKTKNINNPYKKEIYETYVIWRSIPAFLREKKHEDIAEELKIDQELISDLVVIRTQTEFAKKYGIENSTLSNWNKLIEKRDALGDARQWASKFTKNIVFALYQNALKTGNARSVELFFKAISKWNPKQSKQSEYRGVTQFNIQGFKN